MFWAAVTAANPLTARMSDFLQPVVPLVEQLADVPEAEVDVRQIVPQVDRPLEFARFGRADGELVEDFFPAVLLAGRHLGEGLFEVPLGEPPIVPLLE